MLSSYAAADGRFACAASAADPVDVFELYQRVDPFLASGGGSRPTPLAFRKVSGSPDSHPINLHLLRKYGTRVGIADEVSANCNVEEDKERSLKFGRAVYAARDVCFRILDAIDVPPDRG